MSGVHHEPGHRVVFGCLCPGVRGWATVSLFPCSHTRPVLTSPHLTSRSPDEYCCRHHPYRSGPRRSAPRRPEPVRRRHRARTRRRRAHRHRRADRRPGPRLPGPGHRPDVRRAARRHRARRPARLPCARRLHPRRHGRHAVVLRGLVRPRRRLLRLRTWDAARRHGRGLAGPARRRPLRRAHRRDDGARLRHHLRGRGAVSRGRRQPVAERRRRRRAHPFLLGDALKAALAMGLLPAAWKLIGRQG